MKNRIGLPVLGTCLAAAIMVAGFAGQADAASKVQATLRVVGANGKVLADRQFKTGTTAMKTSSKATCLGAGSVNGTVTVKGATALGILAQGSTSLSALRPFGVSSDLGFGPGVCTIGGVTPPSTGYWALKVDHKFSQVGGASAVLKNGSVALWFLVKNYNNPNPGELFLKTRSSAQKNKPVKATVYSYDDKGKRTVVKGAKLNGVKAAATNGNGVTKFKLRKTSSITARKSGELPSNRVKVTVKG